MEKKTQTKDKERKIPQKALAKEKKMGRKKETTNPEMEQLLDKVNELENKILEANDKYLRLFSEFDNYRKRTQKERLEMSKVASEEIITSLLPVVDDLERAGSFDPEKTSSSSLAEGIALINNKLNALLRQKGVEAFDVIGKDFDTDFHEAITYIPAPDESQKGKVIDQVEKGYALNGKVIRFARVVVAN